MRVVPSSERRGGCASRKYRRRHPLKAQTGWSFWTDHPVRAFLTFDGAATPPVPGGDYSIQVHDDSEHIRQANFTTQNTTCDRIPRMKTAIGILAACLL